MTLFTLQIDIPEPIEPIERGNRFDLPLCDVFDEYDTGDVVGGGTVLDENRIVSCQVVVEIEIDSLDQILNSIVAVLEKGQAPSGTTIYQTSPDPRIRLFSVV